MSESSERFVKSLGMVLADAEQRLDKWASDNDFWQIDIKDVGFSVWSQVYGSTACGYPGIGGSAMTGAPCYLVFVPDYALALVYHRQFEYAVYRPGDGFWEKVTRRDLPIKASQKAFAHKFDTDEHNQILMLALPK